MAGDNETTMEKHCYDMKCPNVNDSKNNGQCLICHKLYHYACVGAKTRTVFTCPECAHTILSIKQLNDTLQVVLTQVQSIEKQCQQLRQENKVLKMQLEKERITVENKDAQEHQLIQTKHLVISDSTLRDIDDMKLQDTTFKVLHNASISTIADDLENFHGSSFDSVTYHVATNDLLEIKDDPDKITDVINKYEALISDTKALTNTVIISSVCPRMDDVSEMVEPFNAALKVLCDEQDVQFVDNTPSFTLANGEINDGYIWKHGPYLTRAGVNCVAKNMKLHKKADIQDVTKSPLYNKHGNLQQEQNKSNILINQKGCRYCNEPGHNTATCRHNGPVLCNTCKARGHKSKHHRSTTRRN